MAIPSEEPVPDGSVPDPGPEVTASVADPGDPPVPPSPFTTARAWLRRPTVRKSVRWTASLIIIVFVVEYLLLPQIARARQNLPLLGRVNIILLVLGVLAEAAALGAYAQLTHSVLQPDPPKRNVLLRINLSCFALSHVMPAGAAPGGALGYRLLGDAGVPGSVAALGLAVQAVGSAVVLNLIFWIALVFSIPLNGFNPAYGFAALAGVLLLAAFAGTLLLLSRGDRHADGWLRHAAAKLPWLDPDRVSQLTRQVAERIKVLLADRPVLRRAALWAALNWLLDALCLWIFLCAFGQIVNPIDLLVAYGLANILAAIPLTPGGLGVVETVLYTTLLGFRVDKTVALFGILAYRLVNFWLPIPAGGASYLSLRLTKQRAARAAAAS